MSIDVGQAASNRAALSAQAAARYFEWPMLAAALLSIPAIAIEASGHATPTLKDIATALNWIVWVAFLTEAVTMLALVPNRWAWLRAHPLEVAIVVLTPPFLAGALQALRVFRLLRLLTVVRAVGLTRRLFSLEGVRDAGVAAGAVVLAGGIAFASIEKDQHLSSWDGVWWAVTTVTTVGYGDVYPHTLGGRLIAILVMVVGIGFVSLLTAAAAQRFLRAGADEVPLDAQILERLEAIEAQLRSER